MDWFKWLVTDSEGYASDAVGEAAELDPEHRNLLVNCCRVRCLSVCARVLLLCLRGTSPLSTELHSDCTHSARKLKWIVVARVRRMSSGPRIKCAYFTRHIHVSLAKLRGLNEIWNSANRTRA